MLWQRSRPCSGTSSRTGGRRCRHHICRNPRGPAGSGTRPGTTLRTWPRGRRWRSYSCTVRPVSASTSRSPCTCRWSSAAGWRRTSSGSSRSRCHRPRWRRTRAPGDAPYRSRRQRTCTWSSARSTSTIPRSAPCGRRRLLWACRVSCRASIPDTCNRNSGLGGRTTPRRAALLSRWNRETRTAPQRTVALRAEATFLAERLC